MSVISTTIASVLIFGLVIFIHELGHFVAAKFGGIKVNEFSMGMGPKIFSITRGETTYSLRIFPIGGFVAMEGEDDESEDSRSFGRAPLKTRATVLVAGAAMNILLGFLVLSAIVITDGDITSKTISGFNENAKTQQTGLQVGDEILAINGRKTYVADDILYELARTQEYKADFLILRNGKRTNISGVTFDTKTYEDDYTQIVLDFTVLPITPSVLTVIKEATGKTMSLARLIFLSLIDLVMGRVAVNNLSGPVGIVTVIGDAASIGIRPLAIILALLTVNLGVFNLLPFPALDGGRLFFVGIEAVLRRPMPQRYEAAINAVGFAVLIGLMLFVTFNDITKLITK